MSIIKGAKNMENAKKWYDWALTPEAQAIGAQAKVSYQVPSNKNAPMPAAVAQARPRSSSSTTTSPSTDRRPSARAC